MPYDPERHHRRSIRLPGYDYTTPGAYFITLCAHRRACLFGEVVEGRVCLNALGRAVLARWKTLPRHARVRLDAFVIMPNHVHGILILPDVRRDGDDPVRRGGPGRSDPDRRGDPRRSGDPRRWGEASDSPARPVTGPPSAGDDAAGTGPADASPLRGDDGDGGGGAGGAGRPAGTVPGSVGALVQTFKSTATRKINRLRRTPGAPVWQRDYYERILRDDRALRAVRRYIEQNPARWEEDRNNPRNR